MFRFQNTQHIYEIGGVSFGGQPGTRRTAMIGSLFYPGHSIVEDRTHGKIDTFRLEELINNLESVIDETETPAALMIYAETAGAIVSYLNIISDLTELPLLVDSPSPEVKLAGAKRASEMGLLEKLVYNTLSVGTSKQEFEMLNEIGVKAAVLLAFNPHDFGVKGKIYLLENGNGLLEEGLIEIAHRYGIKKPLIDVAVMSMDQNAGSALRAIIVSKAKWGIPTGCALHNAVESWSMLMRLKEKDARIYRQVDISSAAIPIMAGADFVMYGPIEYARSVFPIAALADELIRQAISDI
ncbi:MAG: tetrahydromethanopterin S-methyltransferase subunit H [Methanomassiliicoccales archaeon]|nr:tetrahydromethanopterin S-methyltransferase subunit H [Methanomassiliicoccales archaeon]